jgi:hypothetical protein
MKKQNRRNFIVTTTLLSTGVAASAFAPAYQEEKQQILHFVLFWLKNPASKEDLNKLIDGLRTLKKIEVVRKIHIGTPAKTEPRPVIDNSYSVSALSFFDDLAGQKIYQDHPVHKKFIENCSKLWEKFLVYDAMDV